MAKNSGLVPITNMNDAVAPADWDDTYAELLTRDSASATGGSGWPWLSTKSKTDFKIGDVSFGDELEVIVLGAIRENAYYEGVYDPQNTGGPNCFAVNTQMDESKMGPPLHLDDRQADKCVDCWANAFGSDDRGRGKACKNTVRLVLLYHEDGQDFAKVEGARLRITPTSLTNWSGYVGQITKGMHRPLFSVVTQISLVPDEKTQFKLSFKPVGVYNDHAILDVLKLRVDEAKTQLEQLPEASSQKDEAPAPQRKKAARKKVVRKKATHK